MRTIAFIKLSNSHQQVWVDPVEFEQLNKYTWSLNDSGYAGAAVKETHGETVFMHHLVIGGARPGYDVHHKNDNKLDNRQSNLEYLTKSEHQMRKGVQVNNTSGYKGVCFDKTKGKWLAVVHVHGKAKFLGRYNTAEEAALVYNEAALKHGGPNAFQNNIKEPNATSQQIPD